MKKDVQAYMPPWECGTDHEHSASEEVWQHKDISTCNDPRKIYRIGVNIHFVLRSDSTGNYRPFDDGLGNPNYTGYHRAEDIINEANALMASNQKMLLPIGNSTPVQPTKIRWVLKGVYFIYDDYQYDNNSGPCDGTEGNFSINGAFGVNTSTDINVFMVEKIIPKHLSGCGEKTADGKACSIGGPCPNGLAAKIFGDQQTQVAYPVWGLFRTADVFNHEIGHLLNLKHTSYTSDDCGDTPSNHPNCWEFGVPVSQPLCFDWNYVSNNMMDANGYLPALTPCQISKMHTSLSTTNQDYVDGCSRCVGTNAFFVWQFGTVTKYQIILNGLASFGESSYCIEIEKVGDASSLQSFCYTGQVGIVDLGPLYNFQAGNGYNIRLITSNTCSESSTYEQSINI